MLSHYDFADLRGDMAVLRRRQTKAPEPIGETPLAEGRFRMGNMMALPAGTQPIWAKINVSPTTLGNSLAPDFTSVTLTAPDGEVTAIRTKKIARDDVNAYFQKPEMGEIGYTALADLAGLGGDYLLGLRMTKDDRSWNCSTQVPVRVGSAGK